VEAEDQSIICWWLLGVEGRLSICSFRKRWGGGGGSIHNLLVIVGGRGKRAGQAELYSQVQTKTKTIIFKII